MQLCDRRIELQLAYAVQFIFDGVNPQLGTLLDLTGAAKGRRKSRPVTRMVTVMVLRLELSARPRRYLRIIETSKRTVMETDNVFHDFALTDIISRYRSFVVDDKGNRR